jgi:methionine-rich copper-binding protein CopC
MKTTPRNKSLTFGGAAVLCALFLSLALAPSALAHARLVKSEPAKNATVPNSRLPEKIDLWFNELLEKGFNTVEVFNSKEITAGKHTNLVKGNVELDPKDHTHLSVKIDKLQPGNYVVEWRVLSRDGHSAPGRITFSIAWAE